MADQITKYLNETNPDILVITGHDAYYDKNNGDILSNSNYKNSINFIKTVINARKYENDHEKLIIIAGACQSNYEELIKAGANFASVSLSNKNKPIDLIEILQKTKYGTDGIGGIITNGTMYVGYPR